MQEARLGADAIRFGDIDCPVGTELRRTGSPDPSIIMIVACYLGDGTLHGPFETIHLENYIVSGTYDRGTLVESRTIHLEPLKPVVPL